MIENLLIKRAALFKIAATLYGDLFVMNEVFWGSVTDKELQENTIQLINLGFKFPDPSEEEIKVAKEIIKDLGLDLED